MSDPALVQGIQQHLEEGDSEEVIKQLVLEAGYTEEEFAEAYEEAQQEASPSVAVAPRPRRNFLPLILSVIVLILIAAIAAALYMYRPWEQFMYLFEVPPVPEAASGLEEVIAEESTEETASVVCLPSPDPADAAARTEIAALKEEKDTLTAQLQGMQDNASSTEYTQGMDRLLEVNARYSVVQSMLAQGAVNVEKEVVESIYATYCGPDAPVSTTTPLISAASATLIDQTDPTQLICSLDAGQYDASTTHHALYALGYQASIAGDLDTAVDLYTCSAERYQNPNSMYRLAQINFRGGQELVQTINGQFKVAATLEKQMPVDLPQAYYWVSMIFATAELFDPSYVDTSTSFGANATAMRDILRSTPELPGDEQVRIQNQVQSDIAAKYPQLFGQTDETQAEEAEAVQTASSSDTASDAAPEQVQ